jgi:hypothetical protein
MQMIQQIQKQIRDIENRISEEKGDLEQLKRLLERLKMQEFEEELRESDNRQLLTG